MKSIGRIAFAVAAFAVAPLGATAQSAAVRLYVNGQRVPVSAGVPSIQHGQALVPLRTVLSLLGATVKWDSSDDIITARIGGKKLIMAVGDRVAFVNGNAVALGAPAVTVGRTTMVSTQFFSRVLGASVFRNPAMNAVYVDWLDSNGEAGSSAPTALFHRSTTGIHGDATNGDSDIGDHQVGGTSGAIDTAPLVNAPPMPAPETNQQTAPQSPNGGVASANTSASSRTAPGTMPQYDRYLRDRDYQRFLNDPATWEEDYDNYAQSNASTSAVQGSDLDSYYRERARLQNTESQSRFLTSEANGATGRTANEGLVSLIAVVSVPMEYMNRTVTVQGTVDRFIGSTALVLRDSETNSKPLLVVGKASVITALAHRHGTIQVTGTLRSFDRKQLTSTNHISLANTSWTQWDNKPALVAVATTPIP